MELRKKIGRYGRMIGRDERREKRRNICQTGPSGRRKGTSPERVCRTALKRLERGTPWERDCGRKRRGMVRRKGEGSMKRQKE